MNATVGWTTHSRPARLKEDELPVTLKRRSAREVMRMLLNRLRTAADQGQLASALAAGLKHQSNYAAYELTGKEQRVPDETKLVKLLDFWGASDRAEVMLEIAAIARSGSRALEKPVGLMSEVELLALFEYFTSSIEAYDNNVVPGLLQIEDYARALLEFYATFTPDLDVEAALALHMDRKAIFDRERPFSITFYVDEAGLRRPVGGAKVLIAQLEHILLWVSRGVVLRVLPQNVVLKPVWRGFELMRFTHQWSVVYSENSFAGKFYEESERVKRAGRYLELLDDTALDAGESTALIQTIIEELKLTT